MAISRCERTGDCEEDMAAEGDTLDAGMFASASAMAWSRATLPIPTKVKVC